MTLHGVKNVITSPIVSIFVPLHANIAGMERDGAVTVLNPSNFIVKGTNKNNKNIRRGNYLDKNLKTGQN